MVLHHWNDFPSVAAPKAKKAAPKKKAGTQYLDKFHAVYSVVHCEGSSGLQVVLHSSLKGNTPVGQTWGHFFKRIV